MATPQGPEYQIGWRHVFEFEGHSIRILAQHSSTRRMPTGRDMVNSMARGKPVTMVSVPIHQWHVSIDGAAGVMIRTNPNGSFSVGSMIPPKDTVIAAAEAWARRSLGRRVQADDQPAPGFR